MTDFNVTTERTLRSQKPTMLSPLFGFHPRLIAAFVAAMMVFMYGLMFAKYGAFDHPVEYLYPAAFVILVLLLLPGLMTVAMFYAVTGQAADLDARTIFVIVAISAIAYGAALRRVREARKDQTP